MSYPAWIDSLVDVVSECVEPHDVMGPMGFRYREEDGFWEIAVYPCLVELRGGDADGDVVSPGFSLGLEPLCSAFDEVVSFHWQPHGLGPFDAADAYIGLEGRYQGHEVWLRVLAEAPEDEEPAVEVDVDDTITARPSPETIH